MITEIYLKTMLQAEEHNGWLYFLCPHCLKGLIACKKTGDRPIMLTCEGRTHYANERELFASLLDVHSSPSEVKK